MHSQLPDARNLIVPLRMLAIITMALAASSCATSIAQLPAAEAAQQATAEPSGWYQYSKVEAASPVVQVWHVIRLDMTRSRLAVSPGDPGSGSEYRARTTSQALMASGAEIAVNGGFYAIPTPPATDRSPPPRGSVLDVMGTSVAGGVTFSGAQSSSRAVTASLCVGASVTIEDGQTCRLEVTDVLSAGPLLLRSGQIADFSAQNGDFANNRHPRTAVGLSGDGKTGWLVVVDGRQPTSGGATLMELAGFLASLGANDAMNLDGGGSAAMVRRRSDGNSQLLSSPIDGGVVGKERAVANHLLVFPR
jgi:hypothetical protein